ncbi:hypothetical protein ACFQ58_11705 [Agromyces sp. NPDC056523]|uniref:hypothetical protein n=1 Tax=Agromyces sp. NPDC056523 TaxID=3345850 RepID=UPI00366DF56E
MVFVDPEVSPRCEARSIIGGGTIMAAIGPPRRADSHDVEFTVEPGPGGDAGIEEAKRVARRRRRRVAVIASLVVAGLAVAATVGERGSSSDESSAAGPVADLAGGVAEEDSVEVIAAWSEIHDGWVRVYSDGRVIWVNQAGPPFERRLTRSGLALVRSGALAPSDIDDLGGQPGAFEVRLRLIRSPRSLLRGPWEGPTETWVEEEFRPYAPSSYALCFWVQLRLFGYNVPATRAIDQLPRAAQELVYGTERQFPSAGVDDPLEREAAVECFELRPEIVSRVLSSMNRVSMVLGPQPGAIRGDPQSPEPFINAVMPDGGLLSWGG